MIFELILQLLVAPKLQEIVLPERAFVQLANIEKNEKQPEFLYNDLVGISITADSAIGVDAKTGAVLFEKNSDEVRSIASITKLMTSLVFLDQGVDMNALVTLKEIDRHNGGMIHFNIGEQIRVADLLYAALVGSDNDASFALMRITGMGEEEFVEAMNAKAKELGMHQTTFTEPTGLDPKNTSTVKDIILLLQEAATKPIIADATTRTSYTFDVIGLDEEDRSVRVYSTDRLAEAKYIRLKTGKTGYLPEAGYCLGTKLEGQNGREYYIVVLGSDQIYDRFQDVKAIEYYMTNVYSY